MKAENKLLYIAIPVCILDVYQKPRCSCPRAPACPKRIRFGTETSSRRQKGLEIPKYPSHSTNSCDRSRPPCYYCSYSSQATAELMDFPVTGSPVHSPKRPTFCSSPVVTRLLLQDTHLVWRRGMGCRSWPCLYVLNEKYASFMTKIHVQGTHMKMRMSRLLPSHLSTHKKGLATGLNVLSLQNGKHQQFSHVLAVLPETWPKRSQSPSERDYYMPHNSSIPKPGEKGSRKLI